MLSDGYVWVEPVWLWCSSLLTGAHWILDKWLSLSTCWGLSGFFPCWHAYLCHIQCVLGVINACMYKVTISVGRWFTHGVSRSSHLVPICGEYTLHILWYCGFMLTYIKFGPSFNLDKECNTIFVLDSQVSLRWCSSVLCLFQGGEEPCSTA